jgi:hypothetical protein
MVSHNPNDVANRYCGNCHAFHADLAGAAKLRVLATLPAREIEGADQVLEGMLVEVSSGNQCRVWPAMTYDAERKQTRIAFFLEWRRLSTPDDIVEVTAFTNTLMGKTPSVTTEGNIDPREDQDNLDWLRSGKAPAPKRSN